MFRATTNPYSLEEVRDSYLTAGKWGLWVHCLVCPTKWTHVLECSSVLMWPLFFSFFQIPVCRSIRRNIWGAYVSSHILQQTWPTTDLGYNWPVPTRGDNVLPFHLTRVYQLMTQWTQKRPPLSPILPSPTLFQPE